MRKLHILLVSFIAFSFVAHAQTKQETLDWLKKNGEIYCDGGATLEISACYIRLYGDAGKIIFPIDEFSKISISSDSSKAFWLLKNGKTVNDRFDRPVVFMCNPTPSIVEKFTKAILHMQTFCKEEQTKDLF
jgi:hypothetical protein